MNERSIIEAPDAAPRGTWVDAYLPDGNMVPAASKPQFINFAIIRGILFRQRWLIGAVITAAIAIGVAWTLLSTPMYEARATLRIIPYTSEIVEGQEIGEGYAGNQLNAYIATQLEVIKSKSLAETVAKENNLGERYDLLGKNIDERRPAGMSDANWLAEKEKRAAQIISQSMFAEMPQGNWIVPIGYRSNNAALAAEMANIYADAAVALDTRKSLASNQFALTYLRDEIDKTRERLRGAEEAANLYARNAGIIVEQTAGADGTVTSTLTSTNLANFNQRFAEARAARIAAEQRWRAIQDLPAAQLSEVQTSPILQSLVGNLSAKRSELTELRQRYSDDFPPIQALNGQIAALNQEIERVGTEIKATSRSQYLITKGQEAALERELASVTGESLDEQDRRVQFGVLEREAQALRDQLKVLLDRFNQLNSATNVTDGSTVKLDNASVPNRPYSPDPWSNMTIAIIAGIAMAAGLAVLRETLDDRVRSLDDVEDKIGLTLLGHTPYVDERDVKSHESDRFSALMESYSSIRAAIDFSLARNQNFVLITSCNPSEGKSTTSLVLAELFGALGRRTLLVDCDLRRPSIAGLLGLERPKFGIAEVVLGHVGMEDAILKDVHQNLDILPVGQIPPNPTELVSSPAFAEFMERCRSEYSLVIMDSAPVLGLADSPVLSRMADATILVLEANRLPFGQVRAVTRRLQLAGANLIGAVLTKYRALEAGQSYNYQYGYYSYSSNDKS